MNEYYGLIYNRLIISYLFICFFVEFINGIWMKILLF